MDNEANSWPSSVRRTRHEALLQLRQLVAGLNQTASTRFAVLAIAAAFLFWFAVWRSDYRSFFTICNHDQGAALRMDELVSDGLVPGQDFFYYYGTLPIVVCRAFFWMVGRSPIALLSLLATCDVALVSGLTSIVLVFKPTRLGIVLVAAAMAHLLAPGIPTHGIEAAMLIWVVALRIRGHTCAAIALCVAALFVKVSMPSVLLGALLGMSLVDAIRTRSGRPLLPILAIPLSAVACLTLCAGVIGTSAVAAGFSPAAGAAIYRAYDYGFFHDGRNFWSPAGHSLGWYLGGTPGPWLVASIALLVLATRGASRVVRSAFAGPLGGGNITADELYVIMGLAHLAFVVAFFSAYVYYYTWILIVGMTPILARARLDGRDDAAAARTTALWASTVLFLIVSSTSPLRVFIAFVRQPRAQVADVTMPLDEVEEWNATTALARSVGHGTVTSFARAANFGAVAPWMRESRAWMMLVGMRKTPSVDELVGQARGSDTIFVTKHDYPDMCRIPEFGSILAASERLHDGKYFMLFRPLPARSP